MELYMIPMQMPTKNLNHYYIERYLHICVHSVHSRNVESTSKPSINEKRNKKLHIFLQGDFQS